MRYYSYRQDKGGIYGLIVIEGQLLINYGRNIFLHRAGRNVCRTRWNRLTSGISELPGSPSESSGVKSYDQRNTERHNFFWRFLP